MSIVKANKITGEEPEEVENIRNKHAGYRRRSTIKKRKLSNKFIEFRFNISYTITPTLKIPRGWVEDFEKLVYNMVLGNVDENELRNTISSDPTLSIVSEEMNMTLEKKEVSDTPENKLMQMWLDGVTIDFKVLPEFAWRDIYNNRVRDFRSTTYFYTSIIYPSRERNSHINPTKDQRRL